VITALFADINLGGIQSSQVQDFMGNKPVINNRIRLLEKPKRLEGQKLRVTRTCAHKRDKSGGYF